MADPSLVALSFSAIIYLVLLFAIFKRRDMRESASRTLAAYTVLSLGWAAVQIVERLQELNLVSAFDHFALQQISVFFLPPLGLIFLRLTRIFERRAITGLTWWVVGAALLTISMVLNGIPLRWIESMDLGQRFNLYRNLAAFVLLVAGWGFFNANALLLILQSYHNKLSPLHRNRNLYWTSALILVVTGQVFFLFRQHLPGSLFHALGLVTGCYAQLTHHLPDLRTYVRRGAGYFVITILTVAIYMVGFLIIQALGNKDSGFQPVLGGAVLALIMVILVNPLLGLIQRVISRTLNGSRYDPHQTLSEYSMSISNILNLEYLAMIVVGLISDAMDISHGALVIVHYERGPGSSKEDGAGSYTLRLITGIGQYIADGRLSESNPVVYSLRREHHPLTQYDIDLLARFKEMDANERAWLDNLDIDVYVPIYVMDAWIGLLALGPKKTGERYYNEDLSLLQTLADQTAIALENARLYEDLKQRNTENEILNAELKQVNNELARLDEAKSDFINIASHELRTPLTQVIGYNDILGEMVKAGELNPKNGKQMIESVRKAAHRLEDIVETMFDVSKLESHTLDLTRAPISLTTVINMAIDTWTKGIQERKQTVTVHGVANLPGITGDGKRLTQVFSNLIQNAIKSTPDGGHIRITGRVVEPGQTNNANAEWCIEVVVEDNGIGIAQEDLERVFQKFYRVGNVLLHSSGDTKFKGAGPGLGLTIARGIVEAHGGRIWAESPGCDESSCPGTKFHVTLPVKQQLAELPEGVLDA